MNRERFDDTVAGALLLLQTMSDLTGIADAKVTPDPKVVGTWLVEGPDWRAIVYTNFGDFEIIDG